MLQTVLEGPIMTYSDSVYLTVKEVADRWGFSTRTIKQFIYDGKLQALQMSTRGSYRIHINEVKRFELESQRGNN